MKDVPPSVCACGALGGELDPHGSLLATMFRLASPIAPRLLNGLHRRILLGENGALHAHASGKRTHFDANAQQKLASLGGLIGWRERRPDPAKSYELARPPTSSLHVEVRVDRRARAGGVLVDVRNL